MSDRAAAYEDWKSGMKYREIAEKYGVSESAVKSWVNRYFKPQKEKEVAGKVATKGKKKLQPSADKLQPKKPGAPMGNRNAKGNAGGGAPQGNQNHRIHGLYSFAFPEDIQKLLERREEADTEKQLDDMIKFWEIREYQLLTEIERQRSVATGLAIQYVTKAGKTTSTTAISTFDRIAQLQTMLTSAQKAHLRCIEALHRVRRETGGEGNGNMPDLMASIDAARKEWQDD